ncbi:MAG: DUF1592 domain-containing protein, partial [Verrucomicrobiota bacterium]
MSEAILSPEAGRIVTKKIFAGPLEGDAPGDALHGGARLLGREGEIFFPHKFLVEGEYLIRVRAYGQQAGPEPARMSVRLDSRNLFTFDVTAEEHNPAVYQICVKVSAGTHKIAGAYINNYRDPRNPDPKQRDRNLIIEYFELVGPLDPKPVPVPETHRRIFTRQPGPNNQAEVAREIIGNFARRAFRRPVASRELDRLMQLFQAADGQGETFEQSVKVALTAVLVSPHFLFRGELQPEPDNPKAVHEINEFALASRLSYFLWSTMPDEELFALAEKKALRKNLATQVKRMLRHPKSRALVDNFAAQWLQIGNLALAAPDKELFPQFDDSLRAAMQKETELFFEHVVREDLSVLTFLDSDFTFANELLARHYGLSGVSGPDFQRVSLKGTPRGGLLTHGSILTITSNPTRTSPVKRGKWILETILGTPPPPPPPDVPELKEGKELTGTLRQRMEQHRDNPLCASCHARMDPIGFGFENFDAVGVWRELDGGAPIDPAGQLVSGERFQGPAELRKILLQAKRDEFVRSLSEKMLTYALGRGLEYYDKCAVD